jgi:hypothetical protein
VDGNARAYLGDLILAKMRLNIGDGCGEVPEAAFFRQVAFIAACLVVFDCPFKLPRKQRAVHMESAKCW